MPLQQFFDMNADLKGMQEDTPFELDQVTFFLKIENYLHFYLSLLFEQPICIITSSCSILQSKQIYTEY